MSQEIQELEPTFSNAELQQMLNDKLTELNLATEELNKVTLEKNQLITRSLQVHEKNKMYEASPRLAQQMAEMDFHLKMAERFIASGAFKAKNAEQAYVIIKAGAEMGMQPVEAMQALYCISGSIKFYGDKMVARITNAGYKIKYLEESKQGVTVHITNEELGFDEKETVLRTDEVFQKSTAVKFAAKNKMRFHAIRMFASFHLPHLFGSAADEFSGDFEEWNTDESGNTKLIVQGEGLLQQINEAATVEALEEIYNDNKAEITKSLSLTSAVGKAKKKFL